MPMDEPKGCEDVSEVKMPQLGETVVEGTVGRWLKQIGDPVEKYEALCEVVTDKVNAEIPSDFKGVLTEILVAEGTTVPVGTPICVIQEAAVSSETQAAKQDSPRFSPAVLQLLQKYRLDPALIEGTGINGRITRKDVMDYVEAASKITAVSSTLSENAGGAPAEAAETATGARSGTVQSNGVIPDTTLSVDANQQYPVHSDTVIAVSPVRRTIAKRMLESKQQVPHAWMMVEVDVTALARFRDKAKEEFQRKEGVPLTYLPFFIKAIVESIKEFPILNSSWAEDTIIIKNDINVSIAVAAGDALYVPVIHKADRQSIAGLAHSISELAFKARNGRLTPAEVQGGTFTINNTGAFGSIQSVPIINTPQAAILTVESIVRRPVVIESDAIAIRSIVNLCLSLDHRVLDGLVCGRFMAAVKGRLETMGTQEVNVY
ncbi:MAG: branched-chain alpha-keto acid dehydrogenase subunit [Bacilli bacterium]|nr:branched-chain alpha-keto acid dehydrogenase subunit [Bacilli bacterium]